MSSFDKKFGHLKISLETIKSATNDFADENLIREGGFGRIYKGKLLKSEKSIDIVARRFDSKSGKGIKEFTMEIMMLDSLKHKNLVSIVGFCDENCEKIIVNKLEAKGSLDKYLSDPSTLTWTQRLQICVQIAGTLSYIHYDKQRNFSVIHGNVKSSKILLDDKWEAKLGGFELSRMQPADRRQSLILDRDISGTYAYVDPSYVKSGGVTHKADVYSLGVVLFEVLCGRKAFVPNKHDEAPPYVEDIKPRAPSFQRTDAYFTEVLVENEGRSGQSLAIQHSNEGPPSSSSGMPPSLSDIEPRQYSDLLQAIDISPPSNRGVERIDYLSEGKYMNTMKNLKHLRISEKGSSLAQLARSHYEKGTLDDIIHPGLKKQMDSRSLKKFSEAAYWCLKEQRAQRPNVDRLLFALQQANAQQLLLKGHYPTAGRGKIWNT